MLFIDVLIIALNLTVLISNLIYTRRILQNLEDLDSKLEELSTANKQSEFDYRASLLNRLDEVQNIRFSTYLKNRGD